MTPTSTQVKVNYLNECIRNLIQYKSELTNSTDDTVTDEITVMISEVFDQLSTIFVSSGPYLVVSELCPFVVQLSKSGDNGNILSQYFEFLEGCFEHSYYVWMLEMLLKHYGLVWKTCPLGRVIEDHFGEASPPKHFKVDNTCDAVYGHSYTGIDALAAIQSIFENVDIPEEIYSAEIFNSLCEDFVFIKFQTAADLKKLYPQVWWTIDDGKTFEGNREAALEASARVEKTYSAVREHQYGIIRAIVKREKVCPWLNKLVEFNKDYNKMVVPNGLSSLMMMANAFHILARCIVSDEFKKDYETIPETLFYNVLIN